MDSSELIRKLNSVGKTAFAQHYDVFLAYADGSLTRMQAIDELVQRRVSNEAGANRRVGSAKAIFEANMEADALVLITASKRLPVAVKEAARRNQGLEASCLSRAVSSERSGPRPPARHDETIGRTLGTSYYCVQPGCADPGCPQK